MDNGDDLGKVAVELEVGLGVGGGGEVSGYLFSGESENGEVFGGELFVGDSAGLDGNQATTRIVSTYVSPGEGDEAFRDEALIGGGDLGFERRGHAWVLCWRVRRRFMICE